MDVLKFHPLADSSLELWGEGPLVVNKDRSVALAMTCISVSLLATRERL